MNWVGPAARIPAHCCKVSTGKRYKAGGMLVSIPSKEEIQAKVISIVAEHLARDPSEMTRETSYQNDLNADSLDIVEVVMDLEEAYDMNVPDEDAQRIDTIGATVDYIHEQLSKKNGDAGSSA